LKQDSKSNLESKKNKFRLRQKSSGEKKIARQVELCFDLFRYARQVLEQTQQRNKLSGIEQE